MAPRTRNAANGADTTVVEEPGILTLDPALDPPDITPEAIAEVERKKQEDDGTVDTAPADGGTNDGAKSLEEQLAEAKAGREAAENARKLAEQRAAAAEQTVQRAGAEITDTRMQVIENALEKEKGNKAAAKQKIIAAQEAGDTAAAVDAQDELQQINIRLRSLEQGKDALAQQIEDNKNRPDPREAYLSTLGTAPRSQQWLRSHMDLLDPNTGMPNPRVMSQHYAAIDAGHAPDSDGYIEFLDQGMGFTDPPPSNGHDTNPPPPPPRRSTQPPPASTRGGGSGAGGNSRLESLGNGRFKLTAAQLEAAAISGMTPTEYAKSLLELEKEGAFDPVRH